MANHTCMSARLVERRLIDMVKQVYDEGIQIAKGLAILKIQAKFSLPPQQIAEEVNRQSNMPEPALWQYCFAPYKERKWARTSLALDRAHLAYPARTLPGEPSACSKNIRKSRIKLELQGAYCRVSSQNTKYIKTTITPNSL